MMNSDEKKEWEVIKENFLKTTIFREYFENEENDVKKWQKRYEENIKNIEHDEPWLTFIAMYSIFSDQVDHNDLNSKKRIQAFNDLLTHSGMVNVPLVKEISEVRLEKRLPEIKKYREYLRLLINNYNDFHFYPDRIQHIQGSHKNVSLEGNTNLDIFIKGTTEANSSVVFFIEAKFVSDISYHTTYNPIRDQIIRIIDTGIDYVESESETNLDYSSFYFLLLTPQIFRIEEYGVGKVSPMNVFIPSRSRLYCYKMSEYKNPHNIRIALPHRAYLPYSVFRSIANNIGWITFEEIIDIAQKNKTIDDELEDEIKEFFKARHLLNVHL